MGMCFEMFGGEKEVETSKENVSPLIDYLIQKFKIDIDNRLESLLLRYVFESLIFKFYFIRDNNQEPNEEVKEEKAPKDVKPSQDTKILEIKH